MAAAASTSLSVANAVWEQIKSSRSVSDDHLSILHFLFGKNFERAARIVDQGGVRRVSGVPSGRSLFLVVGESRRKEEYVCFPEHHCTCYSFFYDIVSRGEQLCCKHQLAARLAEAVGSQTEMKLLQPVELFQKIVKTSSTNQGRLLGLDVGNKYVGLAVSDPHNKIASPVSVLVRKKTNIDLMAKDLQTLVSKLSLVGFIVGYPFNLQGQSSLEAVQVKLFIEDLRKTGKLHTMMYTYWDENFTSKCVEALLSPLNLHPVESKTITDKFAAVGILQGYLDNMHRNLK